MPRSPAPRLKKTKATDHIPKDPFGEKTTNIQFRNRILARVARSKEIAKGPDPEEEYETERMIALSNGVFWEEG